MYKLVNPNNDPVVCWNDKELKTIVKKLFYFANQLATSNINAAEEEKCINEDEVKALVEK